MGFSRFAAFVQILLIFTTAAHGQSADVTLRRELSACGKSYFSCTSNCGRRYNAGNCQDYCDAVEKRCTSGANARYQESVSPPPAPPPKTASTKTTRKSAANARPVGYQCPSYRFEVCYSLPGAPCSWQRFGGGLLVLDIPSRKAWFSHTGQYSGFGDVFDVEGSGILWFRLREVKLTKASILHDVSIETRLPYVSSNFISDRGGGGGSEYCQEEPSIMRFLKVVDDKLVFR